MTEPEIIAELSRLIERLEKCHRLLHSDEMISDEEVEALRAARDLLRQRK